MSTKNGLIMKFFDFSKTPETTLDLKFFRGIINNFDPISKGKFQVKNV